MDDVAGSGHNDQSGSLQATSPAPRLLDDKGGGDKSLRSKGKGKSKKGSGKGKSAKSKMESSSNCVAGDSLKLGIPVFLPSRFAGVRVISTNAI